MIPPVDDGDIEWACDLMGLRVLDNPRKNFLRSLETVDVAACPGSGKTTLIVAKLAMVARRWRHTNRGICVLSHTNAARDEIVSKLGSSEVGQKLLRYPHFIGTIHAFVNRFLATPCLLSLDYPVKSIDDDIAAAVRRRHLGQNYFRLRNFLDHRHKSVDSIRISSADLSIKLGSTDFPTRPEAEMYRLAQSAAAASANEGVFCFDEIFVFGKTLAESEPSVLAALRERFPLVLLDEMQDTTDLQSSILNLTFPREPGTSVVQRVGDPNQSIYGDSDNADGDNGYPDQRPGRLLSIPNSIRFGPVIAAKASPIAAMKIEPAGLEGTGPVRNSDRRPLPAVILFDDEDITKVIDVFGDLVLRELGSAVLAGQKVAAVGAIHKPAQDVVAGHVHFPKTVSHYFPTYEHGYRKQPTKHPDVLCHYFLRARSYVLAGAPVSDCIELVAAGFIRAAELMSGAKAARGQKHHHRVIMEELSGKSDILGAYRKLLVQAVINGVLLDSVSWQATDADIREVVSCLGQCEPTNRSADDFLSWAELPIALAGEHLAVEAEAHANVHRIHRHDGSIEIEVGSIHSVKGQTHCATLILETYHNGHDLQAMLPWLLGDRENSAAAGVRDCRRLKQLFVAMTRPTHLVCIAMRSAALGATPEAQADEAHRFVESGWNVLQVV